SALLEPADDVFHRRLPPRLDLRNHTLVESAARLAEERNRMSLTGNMAPPKGGVMAPFQSA
ncbi:hypothetical protein NLI94_08195, partial [Acidithiobacillus ferrivorans]